jgi:DUF1680 family protein
MNVARLVASIAGDFYGVADTEIAVHLYGGADTTLPVAGGKVHLTETSTYPWSGAVEIAVDPQGCGPFTLSLRIPAWAKGAAASVNGTSVPMIPERGYLKLHRTWAAGDKVTLTLPMHPERTYAHPDVRQDLGRVALRRGPLVYCLEQHDNPAPVNRTRLPAAAPLTDTWSDLLGGITTLHAEAMTADASTWGTALYRSTPPSEARSPILAVPYYIWCNRGANPMQVWLRE